VRLGDLDEDVAGAVLPAAPGLDLGDRSRHHLLRRDRPPLVERVGEHPRRVLDPQLELREPRVFRRERTDVIARVVERLHLPRDQTGRERCQQQQK
jgi:hypothetical protein